MVNESQAQPTPVGTATTPPVAPVAGAGAGGIPWKTTVVVLAIAAGIFFLVKWRTRTSGTGAMGGRPGGEAPPVAAILGTVAEKDVPIYLDGLGTVQAFNTVTVRPRVDGQLQELRFVEGQDVKAGDTLALIDARPFAAQVREAEAKVAQDEALLANARTELKRETDLLASKVSSQADYDNQQAQVRQLEAAVQADTAALERSRVQLNYCTITAPIDGRTGLRLVDAGNVVHANDSNGLVVVTQLKPISVLFTLPEQALREIQAHQRGDPLEVLALDRDNKTELGRGQLAVVDNQIDTGTGTIRLKATLPNETLKLWPGQFVNARLLVATRTNGIVVPASVVQRGPDGPYAFVVNPDYSVRMSPVKVAQLSHEEALIDSGLKAGDRVVVDGQFKLQPGAKVKPAETASPGGPPVSSKTR